MGQLNNPVLPLVAGLIVMWSGTIASIPGGWVICDGTNGTPNLLAMFVQGVATAATNPGTTGGAVTRYLRHTSPNSTSYGAPYVAAPDAHGALATPSVGVGAGLVADDIADIRPPFYDIAFIMKT